MLLCLRTVEDLRRPVLTLRVTSFRSLTAARSWSGLGFTDIFVELLKTGYWFCKPLSGFQFDFVYVTIQCVEVIFYTTGHMLIKHHWEIGKTMAEWIRVICHYFSLDWHKSFNFRHFDDVLFNIRIHLWHFFFFFFFYISSFLSVLFFASFFFCCLSSCIRRKKKLSKALVYYCFLVFRRIGEYISLHLFYTLFIDAVNDVMLLWLAIPSPPPPPTPPLSLSASDCRFVQNEGKGSQRLWKIAV